MVRNSVVRKVRMRMLNAKKVIPLDVVPERRTKRCSPRFRPGDRFCFRQLSAGSEGEKCRPLDNMWQTPFIHWKLVFFDWSSLFPTPVTRLTITLKQFMPGHKRRNDNRDRRKGNFPILKITITLFDSHWVLTLLTITIAITITTLV